MLVILDTSVLVRYFTGDDKKKAALVAKLLISDEDLSVPDVVFVELEYVLRKLYQGTRHQVVEAYRFIASEKNVLISKEVRQAIELFATTALSMADCIVAATAQHGKLASFDKELIRKARAESYWKTGA
jgi:predicted nucleic acid-binding protein